MRATHTAAAHTANNNDDEYKDEYTLYSFIMFSLIFSFYLFVCLFFSFLNISIGLIFGWLNWLLVFQMNNQLAHACYFTSFECIMYSIVSPQLIALHCIGV